MAYPRGSAAIVIRPKIARRVRLVKEAEHRSTLSNTVESLLLEALVTRQAVRDAQRAAHRAKGGVR